MAKVLLVEDEPSLLDLHKMYLEASGHVVIQAETGGKAVALLDGGVLPELAVIDIGLPDMSGIQISSKIKENVKTRAMPVIILTAFTDNKTKLDSSLVGHADLFLNKPIEQADLTAAVGALLDNISKRKEQKLMELRLNFHRRYISD